MAKELPYFKFEPSEWDNGNIQICTHEEQGVFIGLCAMYWVRLGDLPYKLAVQKLCGGNATALDSLYENKIFNIIDGKICIDFLNEQLSEFKIISKTNSKNALLGWEKRRNDATALPPHSERNAIREDKKKEDKKKEDRKRRFTPPTLDQLKFYFLNKLPIQSKANIEAEKFHNHYSSNDWKVGKNKMKDWEASVRGWISRMNDYKGNGKGSGIPPIPDQNWIMNQGKDIQLYQEAAKLWRNNGYEFVKITEASSQKKWRMKQ